MSNRERQPPHKGWYSRGYLPHYDQPDLLQAITFGLADCLPAAVRAALGDTRAAASAERRARLQEQLDLVLGACLLRDGRAAEVVEGALLYQDGKRYRLLAWVVMPSHVHVIVELLDGWPLARVVQGCKGYAAHEINQRLGRQGPYGRGTTGIGTSAMRSICSVRCCTCTATRLLQGWRMSRRPGRIVAPGWWRQPTVCTGEMRSACRPLAQEPARPPAVRGPPWTAGACPACPEQSRGKRSRRGLAGS